MFINTSHDNEYLTLNGVAKELGIDPREAMEHIAKKQCDAIKMRVLNVTKKTREISFYGTDVIREDVNHNRWYIPANTGAIDDIIDFGKYSTSCHIVSFPNQVGMTEEVYIPYSGHKIEATIDTLYITAHHAKVLQQWKQVEDAMKQKDVTEQTTPQPVEPARPIQIEEDELISGKTDLCSAFGLKPTSFTAAKRRVEHAGYEFRREIPGDPTSTPQLYQSEINKIIYLWKKKKVIEK